MTNWLELPDGYADTMDKLERPDDWDVPGIVADASERLRRYSDDGAALAVLDTLAFRMADISRCIGKLAKRIDPASIRMAAKIADTFVYDKEQGGD